MKCTSLFVSEQLNSILTSDMISIEFESVSIPFTMNQHLLFFRNTNATLDSVCHSEQYKPTNLHLLDYSNNIIPSLLSCCFCNALKLKVISLSHNKLNKVHFSAFQKLNNLLLVNLSNNMLSSLDSFMCVSKFSLDISFNEIVNFSTAIAGSLNVLRIITDNFGLCCFFKESDSACSLKPKWPNNCLTLLETVAADRFIIFQFVATVFLNLAAITWTSVEMNRKYVKEGVAGKQNTPKQEQHKESDSFLLSVVSMSISDCLFGLYLTFLFGATSYYGELYVLHSEGWQSSALCFALAGLSIFLGVLSIYITNFITVSKFVAVKFPLNSTLKEKHKVMKYVGMGAVLIIMLDVLFVLAYSLIEKKNSVPLKMCLLAGDSKTSIAVTTLTIMVSIVQKGSFVSLVTQYVLIFKEITKPKPFLTSNQRQLKTSKGTLIAKLGFSLCVNGLSWLPSAVILIVSVVLPQYPIQLLVWNTILVNSVNALLNPVIALIPRLKNCCNKYL